MTGYKLGGTAVSLGATAIALSVIGGLLKLPIGVGIEDFLAQVKVTAVNYFLDQWPKQIGQGLSRRLPYLYVIIDSGIFVPAYMMFLAGVWYEARELLVLHSKHDGQWARWVMRFGAGMLFALVIVDLIENMAGLSRLGDINWGIAGATLLALWTLFGALVYFGIDRNWVRKVFDSTGWCAAGPVIAWLIGGGLFATALTVGAAEFELPSSCGGTEEMLWKAGCSAHAAKVWLGGMLLGGPLAVLAWVQFGPHADQTKWAASVRTRSALVGCLWRTRYVVLALGACLTLLVLMDQGRDVVLAMVSHPWSPGLQGFAAWSTTFLGLGLSALAMWVLGFACWLWARLVMEVQQRGLPLPSKDAPLLVEDHFARDWARVLGVAPAALVMWLVVATLPHAVVLKGNKDPIVLLLIFAVVVLLGAVAFVWRRDHSGAGIHRYYACKTLEDIQALRTAQHTRHNLFRCVSPLWLAPFALTLGLLCRMLQPLSGWPLPTLTIPIAMFLVTFWLCLAGWVSLYEQSESVPWLLFGVVWIGGLGGFGWAENHMVPVVLNGVTEHPVGAFATTLAMATLIAGAFVFLIRGLQAKSVRQRRHWMLAVGFVLVSWGVTLGADYWLSADARKLQPYAAVDADRAVTDWLEEICDRTSRLPDGTPPKKASGGKPCNLPDGPLPVYVVAAEGGGIRSAYWTARVMVEMARKIPGFEQRTFAAAGVSGGAVGLAVYRGCRQQAILHADAEEEARHAAVDACVNRFGASDLLAPLVGAWFFEDALARWLPMTACKMPGCGFMSRGLWFENAMASGVRVKEDDISALRLGMGESRDGLVESTKQHVPFLMLNSTLVETGERVIASELLIDWKHFPGARDQAALLGLQDVPLVAAAHNSGRFPFTNALGSIHTPPEHCTPNAFLLRNAKREEGQPEHAKPCGHLADGGYFDNRAGHSATDLLRLVRSCLSDWVSDPATNTSASGLACLKLDKRKRLFLAENLKITLVLVRNGEKPITPEALKCAPTTLPPEIPQGDIKQVQLSQPRCASSAVLFVDVIGPVITAFQSIGTGSHGRIALARAPGQAEKMSLLAAGEGTLPGRTATLEEAQVLTVDLINDGPLFPLGWHLAPSAQIGMKEKAQEAVDTLVLSQNAKP